jgi:hypothetical protein
MEINRIGGAGQTGGLPPPHHEPNKTPLKNVESGIVVKISDEAIKRFENDLSSIEVQINIGNVNKRSNNATSFFSEIIRFINSIFNK